MITRAEKHKYPPILLEAQYDIIMANPAYDITNLQDIKVRLLKSAKKIFKRKNDESLQHHWLHKHHKILKVTTASFQLNDMTENPRRKVDLYA